MNMNQIMNMILRLFMRKAINTGINAGIKAASNRGHKPPVQANMQADDDLGHTPQQAHPDQDGEMSQAQVRQRRQARRAARQARQATKVVRRASKM